MDRIRKKGEDRGNKKDRMMERRRNQGWKEGTEKIETKGGKKSGKPKE